MEETEQIDIQTATKQFIPNENIYKAHILDENGEVSHVFIFCAGLRSSEYMEDIFSKIELHYYREKEVQLIFSDQLIHKDDTIRSIKFKLMNEFLELSKQNKHSPTVSIEEMYMFGHQEKYLDMIQLYQEIIDNDKKKLTKERFFQYATNISTNPYDLDDGTPEKGGLNNDVFTYEQWMNLCESGPREMFVPIGMEFREYYDFMFPSNPYKNQLWTEPVRYELSEKNPLLSFEKSLLLDYSPKNNIMVCLAKHVFDYGEKNNMKSEYLCELYFPFLYKLGVVSKTLLEQQKLELANDSEKKNTKQMKRSFEVSQIYREASWSIKDKQSMRYNERGIREFSFELQTIHNMNFPLDYVFRNLHSTKEVPFIKYNPGSRKENMYRIYSNNISVDGKKIPVLEESIIMRLVREIGKGRQISLYVQDKINIIVNIQPDGNIRINGSLKELYDLETLNEILRTMIQPIITELNNILQPLGYSLKNFEHMKHDNVKNVRFSHEYILPIEVKMNLQKQMDSITPIFDVISTDISKGAKMRFKRVRNYKEMDAKAAIIREIYDRSGNSEDVIQGLMDNFDMSDEEAIITFGEFRSQFQLLKKQVIENPGFETTMKMKPLKNELVVSIKDINSTKYISELSLYIDVILRMSQKPKSISLEASKLKKMKIKSSDLKIQDDVETVIAPIGNLTELYKPSSQNVQEDEEEKIEDDGQQGIELDDADYYQDFDEEDYAVNEEEEEEEDEEEEDEYYGGENSPEEEEEEKYRANIDGMPIKNPSPFFRRMRDLDPTLYVTEESSKFPLYSKACPSGDRRQPVILTNEEKKRIDETNPGSYGHALNYGSSEDKKHWYICPRYWCLKTNSSISEEDVRAGKCGSIIPRGADRVPKGAYVYEFNNPKNHMKDGKYVQHVPGFLKKDKHPDGLCIPCCFGKAWDSKDQVKRRDVCEYDPSKEKEDKPDGKKKASKKSETELVLPKTTSYIISAVSYPLPQNRWGFLPLSLQLFLKSDSSLSVEVKNSALIRGGEKCLLRYGIEKSENQSFLGCLAYFYSYKQNLDYVPSIEEMRSLIVDAIDLDMFVQYHNGNLVSIFRPQTMSDFSINIEDYEEMNFYKTIDLKDDIQTRYLEETIASFMNFSKFLKSDSSTIDHTYLWDFFCHRNKNLLQDGMNLIILQISDDDITERVQFICPSNAYSSIEYDERKESALIVKQGSFYEPVHLYEHNESIVVSKTNAMVYSFENGDYLSVNKVFDKNAQIVYKLKSGEAKKNDIVYKKAFLQYTAIHEIREMLKLIESSRKKYCGPLSSMPRKYNFKRGLNVLELIRILKIHHYQVQEQVLNYRNKVIGIRVLKEDGQSLLYVPCFPSSILKDYKSVYMDDPNIWLDYRQTRDRLHVISNDTNGKVPTSPEIKVIEDGLIIGIITETNQFVQINPPTQSIDNDGLKEINHRGYSYSKTKYESAEKTLTTETEPNMRTNVIKKVDLESQFYSIFRSLVRIQLNNYENRQLRKTILDIMEDAYLSYRYKWKKVQESLKKLVGNHIDFKDMGEKELQNVEKIFMCNENNCKDDSKPIYCLTTDQGKCMSLFPKKHLLSDLDNELIYYGRMADELIRYNRTRLFMLYPKTYMNITNVDYHIEDEELFLLENKLNREYFRGLIPYGSGDFKQNITYDNAQPDDHVKSTQTYSNKISLLEQDGLLENKVDQKNEKKLQDFIIDCIERTKPSVVGNTKVGSWKRVFPNTAKEVFFNKSVNCSYIPMIYIFQEIYFTTISVKNIKTTLWKGYSDIFNKVGISEEKVISILKMQGKHQLMKSILTKQSSFESIIMSDDYYITDLDWWVFCTTAQMPVILFSSTTMKSLSPTLTWLRLGGRGRKGEKFFYVRTPPVESNIPPGYHVIQNSYSFSELQEDIFVQAERGEDKYKPNMVTIQEYLSKTQTKVIARVR